jgi:hypothetical protein
VEPVELWQSRNEVGIDPLTGDTDVNATLVVGAVFCGRQLMPGSSNDGPLLCIDNAVMGRRSESSCAVDLGHGLGPIIKWVAVGNNDRMRYAVQRLIDQYGYPTARRVWSRTGRASRRCCRLLWNPCRAEDPARPHPARLRPHPRILKS